MKKRDAVRIVKNLPPTTTNTVAAGYWTDVFNKLTNEAYVHIPKEVGFAASPARTNAIAALGKFLIEVVARPDGLYIRLR